MPTLFRFVRYLRKVIPSVEVTVKEQQTHTEQNVSKSGQVIRARSFLVRKHFSKEAEYFGDSWLKPRIQ